ncbi:PREDICTED: basic proline-rich protein-like, partial [Capra hircus]|uniref:basic proline-rich protein-like n=1 Tax=Capra hircus TaxID=9925 RepID=UPI000846D96F
EPGGRLVDPPPPGKKGRAQGPRRRPRAVLPLPAGRDGTEGRDTRADARVGGDWLAPPAPRPARPPRARGPRGRPATAPDSRPRHASPPVPRPSPRARTRGGEAEEGARHPEAGRRRQGRPPPLLSSHVGPRPLRGGRRSPPPPTGARGRGHAAARPRRGGAPAEGRERERASDKPLCRGLTFNRSQRGSCSATYETPTQKQVVYEWFSTRCPTNVRCVTGEGAAAFPAAPRVPGRRALRTGPRSRRAAGARRAAAPRGGNAGDGPPAGTAGDRLSEADRGSRGAAVYRPSQTPHLALSPERVAPGRRAAGRLAPEARAPRGSPPRLTGLESSSTGSSFPADSAKPVPLAVVSLDILSRLLGAGRGEAPRGTAAPGAHPAGGTDAPAAAGREGRRGGGGAGEGGTRRAPADGGAARAGGGPPAPARAAAADGRRTRPAPGPGPPPRAPRARPGGAPAPAGLPGGGRDARRSWGDPREGPGSRPESPPPPAPPGARAPAGCTAPAAGAPAGLPAPAPPPRPAAPPPTTPAPRPPAEEGLRIRLADFPYLHCSNMPEAVHLGDLLRIWGQRELTGRRRNRDAFQGAGPSLGANPFQGALPFTKKRELSPGLPPASPGSVALPHWTPRGARLRHSGFGDLNPTPFRSAEGNGGHRPSLRNGICTCGGSTRARALGFKAHRSGPPTRRGFTIFRVLTRALVLHLPGAAGETGRWCALGGLGEASGSHLGRRLRAAFTFIAPRRLSRVGWVADIAADPVRSLGVPAVLPETRPPGPDGATRPGRTGDSPPRPDPTPAPAKGGGRRAGAGERSRRGRGGPAPREETPARPPAGDAPSRERDPRGGGERREGGERGDEGWLPRPRDSASAAAGGAVTPGEGGPAAAARRRRGPPEPPSPPGLPSRPGAGRGAPPRWKCARRRPVAGRGAVPRRPHPRPRPPTPATPPPPPAARPEADGESGEGRREGGWRGREARGAGKIRRAAGTAGPAAGLNPPGGLRGPHPFTS